MELIGAGVLIFGTLAGLALVLKAFYEGEAKLPPSPPKIQPDPVWQTSYTPACTCGTVGNLPCPVHNATTTRVPPNTSGAETGAES